MKKIILKYLDNNKKRCKIRTYILKAMKRRVIHNEYYRELSVGERKCWNVNEAGLGAAYESMSGVPVIEPEYLNLCWL